ncbi:MAG: CHAT domain-containing protein [Acidimicrobiales bacterium]
MVALAGLGYLALGRDAITVAVVGVALGFAVGFLRRRIEERMVAGPRHAHRPRTLTARDTGFRLHGVWRAAELATADPSHPGIAIALLRQLAAEAKTASEPVVAAVANARLAVLELGRGHAQRADASARVASELLEASSPARRRRTEALARAGIALVRLELGQDALEILPQLEHLPARWPATREARQLCVDAYIRAGRPDDAVAVMSKAHQGLSGSRDMATTIDSQVAAAHAMVARGELNAAKAYILKELSPRIEELANTATRDEVPGPDLRARIVAASGRTALLLGDIELRNGFAADALAAFEQAVVRVRPTGAHVLVTTALVLKGAALSGLGRWEECVAAIEEGVDVIEAQRRQLASGDARTQAIVSSARLYRVAFESLHAVQLADGSNRAGIVAATLMEALHQSALADALHAVQFDLGPEAGELHQRMSELEAGARQNASGVGARLGEQREAAVDAIRSDLADTVSRAFAQAYLPRQVDLDELRITCGQAHVLSYYHCPTDEGPTGYCVWLAPEGQPVVHVVQVRDPDAAALLAFLASNLGTEPLCLTQTVRTGNHHAMWSSLGESLLPPGLLVQLRKLDRSEALHLIVVPDGPLARIPWPAVLVDQDRTLAEVAAIQMIPALELLDPSASAASMATRGIFHADPDLMNDVATEAFVGAVSESSASRMLLVPYKTRDEIVAALRHPWWAGIVFAAHGKGSGLNQQVKLGDGTFLSIADVLAGNLRWPPWVFFGSCFVGSVEQRVGGEALGLPIACLLGGAHTVIGGTVEVAKEQTDRLSRDALAGMAEGLHPARALRQAQLALGRGPAFTKVNGWAAFTCISRIPPGAAMSGGPAAHWASAADDISVQVDAVASPTPPDRVGNRPKHQAALDETADLRRRLADASLLQRPTLAAALGNHCSTLAKLGLFDAALEANDEVLPIYRGLHEANPEKYVDQFATVLNQRSIYLGALGRHDAAFTAVHEAVTIIRPRAASDPDKYLRDLAKLLHNMSNDLGRLGRHDGAVAAISEAVRIRRCLADNDPNRFLRLLALSTETLADHLRAAKQPDESRAALEEAIHLRRTLAGSGPSADVARLLVELGKGLDDTGHYELSVVVLDEAVSNYREVTDEYPRYLRDLSSSLRRLSDALKSVGRTEPRRAAMDEAVTIRRRLALADPAQLDLLAMYLDRLCEPLSELARYEEAAAAREEAVAIWRRLCDAEPAEHLAQLGTSLHNLSVDLDVADHDKDALAACDEALGIRRRLAAGDPSHLPRLRTTLTLRARLLRHSGRHDESLGAIEEATAACRRLAAADASTHLADLACSLSTQKTALLRLGRTPGALMAIEEAAGIYRHLAEDDPQAHLHRLAMALRIVSDLRVELGQPRGSLSAIEEALGIARRLVESDQWTYLRDLAMLLATMSEGHRDLGDMHKALAAIDEVVAIRRSLARQDDGTGGPELSSALRERATVLTKLGRSEEARSAIDDAEAVSPVPEGTL